MNEALGYFVNRSFHVRHYLFLFLYEFQSKLGKCSTVTSACFTEIKKKVDLYERIKKTCGMTCACKSLSQLRSEKRLSNACQHFRCKLQALHVGDGEPVSDRTYVNYLR